MYEKEEIKIFDRYDYDKVVQADDCVGDMAFTIVYMKMQCFL